MALAINSQLANIAKRKFYIFLTPKRKQKKYFCLTLFNTALNDPKKSPDMGLYLSIPQQNIQRYSPNVVSPNSSIHSKISETYVDFKNNIKVSNF